MPGRFWPGNTVPAGGYRFGFNGMEKDDEVKGITGSHYHTHFRSYDPRTGRWWSIDPLDADYPWLSPYVFAANRVIDGIDLEGLEYVAVNDVRYYSQYSPITELVFKEFNVIEYNGVQYYNVGRHVFVNHQSGTVSFDQFNNSYRLSQWVYNPVGATITQNEWVKYDPNVPGGCFAAACGAAGYKPGDYWGPIDDPEAGDVQFQMYSRGTFPGLDYSITRQKAIYEINTSIEKGTPVVVGVDYAPGSANPETDQQTEHFITIYERGSDEKGEYFLFSENVAKDSESGLASYRRLYLQENGTLKTMEGKAAYSPELIYTVTQVRPSKDVKKQEKEVSKKKTE